MRHVCSPGRHTDPVWSTRLFPPSPSPWFLLAAALAGGACTTGGEFLRAEEPAPPSVVHEARPSLDAVALPPGDTYIEDLGIFRVSWQSYGKDPVAMPIGWCGHFSPPSGISCQGWGRVLGRRALLLHSPWLVPVGKTRVDYRLALPDVRPIRLSFGVAMGPDVAVPGRSDGVTFSAYLVSGGAEKELFRRHHDKGEWLDLSFDLSAEAGKTIGIGLQVEPGPAGNAGWDYSFFGDAKFTVGAGGETPRDALRRVTGSKAYRAVAGRSLVPLGTAPGDGVGSGIVPGNLLPVFRNSLEKSGESWRFAYEGDDGRIEYVIQPATGTLDDLSVVVDGGRRFLPAFGGGVSVEPEPGTGTVIVRGGKAVAIERDGEASYALRLVWDHDVGEALPSEAPRPLRVSWRFRIAGKAIVISAASEDPRVAAFSLGDAGLAPFRRTVPIPYLAGSVSYLPRAELFACRYLDWTLSHSSSCPQGSAAYDRMTDGKRNPLRETGYISVSPDLREVLPQIPHPPSPHLGLLGPRVMLDIWGHRRGTYEGDAENLRRLSDHGIDHLAIISHDWQRYGYDVKLPDHIPANPSYGGEEGMVAFGKAANDCGYVWSLHENYIDLYPDAPSYDPSARVLLADGSPSPAWYNPGTKVQSFGLKCNRALGYAKANSPEVHRRYGTNAAYLDVHTCVPPWHQLDHEAGQPMAGMALAKVRFDTELFQYERDTHGGPLFGEGANHFYWAGRCDGVEAQVQGGEDHTPLVDFDLLRIHPRMVNHGMGYYERWFRRGYSHEWGVDTGTPEQIDKYRAQEIAYGHAGFVGGAQVDNVQWVLREHHLVHPLQRLYGDSRVAEILYEVEGDLVTASAAVAAGDTSRQRVRYENGLTVWVNWREQPWIVDRHILPQWGFLGRGSGTEVWTAVVDGRIADHAECPEFIFADARTHFEAPYLMKRKHIEPRVRSFEDLGGGRVRITYEWLVNDVLGDDHVCFVHAVARDGTDEIIFQGDHALSRPTTSWKPGETIVDGPHELRVSGARDAYDLVMGLFKGSRVPLEGIELSGARILVGCLRVERGAGGIAKVVFDPPLPRAGKAVRADFTSRLNPSGTWVEFGKVATDGAVKIERGAGGLTVLPYPRETPFLVAIDLPALSGGADVSRISVRELAAGTRQDLGPADSFEFAEGGRKLLLRVGKPGVGRYVITWK